MPNVEALARELAAAYETGRMVVSPPSSRLPDFNLEAAYAVERELKRTRESAGHRAVGRKVGYANKAVWRVFKLDTLVWAHMYDDTVHYADTSALTVALPHARSLKVEPEIVFSLKQPMSAEVNDAAAALACVDWLAIGFEIIDCPYTDWKFQPADFVASFGLHAALVIGERKPVNAETIPTLVEELPRFKVRVAKNGEFVEEGSGKNSLRSPALCLAELATAIARRFPDEPLKAGEIISSGTLTSGHSARSGEEWQVDVEGLPLPGLTFRM